MHTTYAYMKWHKKHHEYISPFSLTGEIAHPIEFFFNFLIPIMIGPLLMGLIQGVHVTTYWIWITYRELRSVDAHSGYNLPFHPLRLISPVYGGAHFHDFHHNIKGRNGNFGGYRFWDWLMGTDSDYMKYCQENIAKFSK